MPYGAPFFSPIPAHQIGETVRLLNVGTIISYKRQIEILRVCQKLYENGYRLRMDFIGVGGQDPYAQMFFKLISQPGVRDYATFLGFKDREQDLIDIFDTSHGCIHFPSEEAFGLVVAEGLARNLKLFGAMVGGVPDIMKGVEGAELLGRDDWTGLEKGIARWMDMGAPIPSNAAETMSQRYHPLVIAQKHLDIYDEVLSDLRSSLI